MHTRNARVGRVLGLTPQETQAVRRHQNDLKQNWTEAEVQAEGLLRYYARDWFIRELNRLGCLAAMEAEYDYSNQVLSKWAKRHGLSLRPNIEPGLRPEARALRAVGHSYAQIAAELRISKATAQRLVKQG